MSGRVAAPPSTPPDARPTDDLPSADAAGTAVDPTLDLSPYLEKVRRFCRSRTTSDVDAEDAAQQTFIRFLEHAGPDVRNPEAWLIQAASFECRDLHRRNRRHQAPVPISDATEVPTGDPEKLVSHRLLLRDLMHRLPARDRQLLTLRYLADLSVEQLAARLRVSEVNARVMALRARRRAHEILRDMGEGVAGVAFGVPLGLRGLRVRVADWLHRNWARLARASDVSGAGAIPLVTQVLVPGLVVAVAAAAGGDARAIRPAAASSPSSIVADAAARFSISEQDGVATPGRRTLSEAGPSATAGPSQGGNVQVTGLVASIVAPPTNRPQSDAGFGSVAVSPDYSNDHTLYASGVLLRGCATACPVLFKSPDGGGSWRQDASATGFKGGLISLSSEFAADHVVLGLSSMGLQWSRADGAFTNPIPSVSAVAPDPSSPPGDSRVALGTLPLTVLHLHSGQVSAGPALPAGIVGIQDMAYADTLGDLVVSGFEFDPTAPGQQDAIVLRCDRTRCGIVRTFSGPQSVHLAVAPGAAAAGVVYAFTGGEIDVSHDAGASFAALAFRPNGPLISVAPSANGALFVVSLPATASGAGTVERSIDGGRTFLALAATGLPSKLQLSLVSAQPDGRVVAALAEPTDAGAFGLRCSTDAGNTWSSSC